MYWKSYAPLIKEIDAALSARVEQTVTTPKVTFAGFPANLGEAGVRMTLASVGGVANFEAAVSDDGLSLDGSAEFDDVDTVKIAAMDATAHEPPSTFEVQGYPTIFFVPKGGSPVSYDGPRDLDSMVDYIKTNAATLKDEL
jgi:hypothetical protein